MKNKTVLYSFIFFFLSLSLYSQGNKKIDSLRVLIRQYEKRNKDKSISISDSVKVNLLIKLCMAYNYDSPNIALVEVRKAHSLAKEIGYKKGIAHSYFHIGRVLGNTGKFEEGIASIEKAIPIYKDLKDEFKIADSYNNIGIYYAQHQNIPQALDASLKAIKIYEKRKETTILAGAYLNTGIIFEMQEKFDEALKYYLKSLKFINEENKNDIEFVAAYVSIGQLYTRQKRYSESIKMHFKAYEITKHMQGQDYSNSIIFLSLGGNYKELKQYDKALEYYRSAIEILKRIEDYKTEYLGQINMGYCLYKKGEVQKGIEMINKGLNSGKKEKFLDSQSLGHAYLSEIHKEESNYKEAYENEATYKILKDSVLNMDNEKKITQMQMQYEFDKVQDETRQKQAEKELILNQETDKERSIKYIVMIVLCGVTLLTFGVFFNLRKNQKQKAVIAQQKEMVEEQNVVIQQSLTEKETLLREIHHRVKNNLQIISSLLNIQSQHISDENVLSSIQEGQSRVQAMSLIHQNLYQSEHLGNVNIENYLRELVIYLSEMFAGEDKSIVVEVEAENIKFDIDTAIPLGLIVNELVSNAYKYAFDKKDSGNIKIKIKALNSIDYELDVNDDGNGLPADFDPKKSKSLGLKLVTILSRQLRGMMDVDSNNGTSFIVKFKDLKTYQTSI